MGFPLEPSLDNAFLAHKQNLLDRYPLGDTLLYYWQYLNDIFVLFISSDHNDFKFI